MANTKFDVFHPRCHLLLGIALLLCLRHGGYCAKNSQTETDDVIYRIGDGKTSHHEARAACKSEGGSLAAVSSRSMEILADQIAESKSNLFWVDTKVENEQPEPDNSLSENVDQNLHGNETFPCFVISATGISEHDCNRRESFVCQYFNGDASSSDHCPQDALRARYSKTCFWRTNEDVTMSGSWSEVHAYDVCAQTDGSLASVDDIIREGVRSFHRGSLLKGHRSDLYWIDLILDGKNIAKPSGEILKNSAYVLHPANGSCVAIKFDVEDLPFLSLHQVECSLRKHAVCQSGYIETDESDFMNQGKMVRRSSDIRSLHCPHGYNWKEDRETGFCYWETSYETPRSSWVNARKYCQSYGGDLASFHSRKEEMIGLSFQYGSLMHPYWIGLRYDVENNTYVWTDSTPVDYSNWAPDQPDHRNSRMRCVQMHASEKHWMVSYCGVLSWFVCKAPKQAFPRIPVLPTTEPLKSCSSSSNGYFFNGYCYESFAMDFTWHRAQRDCENQGGNLVSVHSEEEIDFLIKLLAYHTSQSGNRIWIGLNAMTRDSQFKWSDGTQLDFVNWNYDEPNNVLNQEKCCNMYVGNGLWNDENCNNMMGFVCKRKNDTSGESLPVTVTAPPVTGNCKKDWFPFKDNCYLPIGAKKSDWANWTDAAFRCHDFGGHLTSVHDDQQQTFLTLLLQNIKADAWIGLHDNIQSGVYYWFDNTALDYTNWAPGEPSFLGIKEDCVLLLYNNTNSGVWKDHVCSTALPYICETSRDPAITDPPENRNLNCIHPADWLKMGTSCYKIISNALDWNDARNTCQSYHAELVSVSDFTTQAVVKYLAAYHNESFWIGLTVNKNGEFSWLNKWPVALSQWDKNQPDLRGNQKLCFMSSPDGYWKSVPCSEEGHFICQITAEASPPSVEYKARTCYDDYEDLGGNVCYYFQSSVANNWHSANFFCFSRGDYLASIHSMEEIETLKQMNLNKSYYIGLTRNKKGGFTWSDGSPVDFVYWNQAEPENEDDRCVAMLPYSLKWSVVPCTFVKYFICSREKAKMNSSSGTSDEYSRPREDLYTGITGGALAAIIVSLLIVLAAAIMILIYFGPLRNLRFRMFSPQERITSFENALFDENSMEMHNSKNELCVNE